MWGRRTLYWAALITRAPQMSAFNKDQQPLGSPEALARHIQLALAAETPRGLELELSYQFMKRLFKPMVLGADNIPERPCLFVGNHSLFALDGWVISPLFVNPQLGEFLLKRGGVLGHPQVCAALMEAGKDLLVFPGGAYEAVKPASQKYELL